ncbi:Putative LETM1-like protein [Klebsormidium nitens]|uniref:Putative LETM1-like protein n=1 Tax=Klebsormidium nitens TaxID=105231 RepID=A0A1Y1ILJ2_KLENI|nr:Putative LETM1-like protein [Klebsormidium nitens]|eukprot:GAQ91745.1 Putative LETM1-like protein [Klebsormidium nitens]
MRVSCSQSALTNSILKVSYGGAPTIHLSSKVELATPLSSPSGDVIVTALHEHAERLRLALVEQESLTKGPWFAQKWLGIDKNAWMRSVGYQAAVHALLKAAGDVADRGEARDRDAHTVVIKSLARQRAPLESAITAALDARDPLAGGWFWAVPYPPALQSLLGVLENDGRFGVCTALREAACEPGVESDAALLKMALHVEGAVAKLGQAAMDCDPFPAILEEEVEKLMNLLGTLVSSEKVYETACASGLRREFLERYARRAAERLSNNARLIAPEEKAFWIDLVERQLGVALAREGPDLLGMARAPQEDSSPDSLKTDLAIFGFFVALGRSTRLFLSAKGAAEDEAMGGLLRYFEGGGVLFYPELARLPLFQLFVEVVCEEMQWLPFYPGEELSAGSGDHGHGGAALPLASRAERAAALAKAAATCQRWLEDFEAHSRHLRSHPQSRAARFLRGCKSRLAACNAVLAKPPPRQIPGVPKPSSVTVPQIETEASELDRGLFSAVGRATAGGFRNVGRLFSRPKSEVKPAAPRDVPPRKSVQSQRFSHPPPPTGAFPRPPSTSSLSSSSSSGSLYSDDDLPYEGGQFWESGSGSAFGGPDSGQPEEDDELRTMERQLSRFDSELSGVDAAMEKLDRLVQESEGGAAQKGDVETLKKLKGEVEALEAVFKTKKAEVEKGLRKKKRRKNKGTGTVIIDSDKQEVWGSAGWQDAVGRAGALFGVGPLPDLPNPLEWFSETPEKPRTSSSAIQAPPSPVSVPWSLPIFSEEERRQAEGGRSDAARSGELSPEEKRGIIEAELARAENQSNGRPAADAAEAAAYGDAPYWEEDSPVAAAAGDYRQFLAASIDKLKQGGEDAWRGTKLLGSDVAAALGLLQRGARGQSLSAREQRFLKRTLTDVASVIPIGIVMLLPITAVGHAFFLAMLQKYAPGLIPSTFASERLGLLKRFEQVKTMEAQQMDVLSERDPIEEQKPGVRDPNGQAGVSDDGEEAVAGVRQSLAEGLDKGTASNGQMSLGTTKWSRLGTEPPGTALGEELEGRHKEESGGIGRK